MENTGKEWCFITGEEDAGLRLDAVLSKHFHDYSRKYWQERIKKRDVLLNGKGVLPKKRLVGGENIQCSLPKEISSASLIAQNLGLQIVYADADLVVVNKRAGMVTHPAPGHRDGTLLNALLYLYPSLADLPRCGIVHRLDRYTSGLLVAARNISSYNNLVQQLQKREIVRRYWAIVEGRVLSGGTVDAPIARHPINRMKMAVRSDGRNAVTHFLVHKHFQSYTLLDIKLQTGRTHQIRVHMASLGFPVAGDRRYGGRRKLSGMPSTATEENCVVDRPALHARALSLLHPQYRSIFCWVSFLPTDMKNILCQLESTPDQT